MKALPVLILLLTLPLAAAVYPGDPGFKGCVISNPDGVFNDVDCDHVPDIVDNCPLVQNPVQADGDKNGRGDLCDLVIDEIVLEPSEPIQGRSLLVRAASFNNRPYPLRNALMKVEIPSLGISQSMPLPLIDAGQRVFSDMLVRIPECAPPRDTDVVVIVEYPLEPGVKEVFSNSVRVPIRKSGLCPLDPGEDLTVVDILEIQDVNPETGAVYPFTIKNNWPESKAYILTVTGHEAWGFIEIDPGSVIVIPPGGSREGQLRVFAREGVTGEKSFTLTVRASDDIKQKVLLADIPEPAKEYDPKNDQFIMGLVMFIILLVIIVAVLVYLGEKRKRSVRTELQSTLPARERPRKQTKKKQTKKKQTKKKLKPKR